MSFLLNFLVFTSYFPCSFLLISLSFPLTSLVYFLRSFSFLGPFHVLLRSCLFLVIFRVLYLCFPCPFVAFRCPFVVLVLSFRCLFIFLSLSFCCSFIFLSLSFPLPFLIVSLIFPCPFLVLVLSFPCPFRVLFLSFPFPFLVFSLSFVLVLCYRSPSRKQPYPDRISSVSQIIIIIILFPSSAQLLFCWIRTRIECEYEVVVRTGDRYIKREGDLETDRYVDG